MLSAIFPAVLIGGPPHSGKSVLVYSLTRALRAARVPHYVLRACPDGEGDWSNETDEAVVRTIRRKGPFNNAFVNSVAAYLQKRHLPLLVDVGGKPTPDQEALFGLCTHAILLIGDRPDDAGAYARDTAVWQEIANRQQLPIIAQIKSILQGENQLITAAPTVTGTIAGLERGTAVSGPAFDALVERLTRLFDYSEPELTSVHLAQAPVELTLDLPVLAKTLGALAGRWSPQQIPALLDYLPEQTPLAIYGRAPNWIYSALALHALPAPVWLFDARLGWITPPDLPITEDGNTAVSAVQTGWHASQRPGPGYTILEMATKSQYLNWENPGGLPLPEPQISAGLILSGKIPNWLLLAAARQFAPDFDWLAVYQPQLGGAVVVNSGNQAYPLGKIVSI